MMNIRTFDRSLPREMWYEIYEFMRKAGEVERSIGGVLGERERFVKHLRKVAENGKVCVVESGRDCDCVQFVHGAIRDASVPRKLIRDEESAWEWADGPLYFSYVRPSERPDSYSRDLALEAYENGHPHFVTGATV